MGVIGQESLGQFPAKGEDGRTVMLEILVDVLDVGTRRAPHETEHGIKRIVTVEDGFTVNRLGKGRYEIFQTDEVLTSDDPDAP